MNVADLKGKTVAALVSGGLDSCTIVRWLTDNGVNVVCFTGDLGQPDEPDLSKVQKRLLASGAKESIIIDGKEQMAKAGCLAIQSQAIYEGEYWNTTGIGRHVLVLITIPEMKKKGLNVLVHGATGRGNDQVRFQLITNMFEPMFEVYAPWRDEAFLKKFGGRKQMIDFCLERNLPIKHTHDKPYSTDANLLGLTHEAGKLEFLDTPALFIEPEMGASPMNAPNEKETFEVTFEKGWPVKINGADVTAYEALDGANKIAGKHGVGIARHVVENRFVGIKSRGVYEMPGITLLGKCYSYLLEMVLDRRARNLFQTLSTFIGQQIYEGYWFAPASQAAMTAVESFAKFITGVVSVDLYKGQIFFKEAKNISHGLYSSEDASMESIGSFNHADSEGFLKVLGIGAKALSVHKQIDVKAIKEKIGAK